MRIISNFHDYYDTAMSYGQNRELIYLRKPKEIKTSIFSGTGNAGYRHSNKRLLYETIGVGFCGKVYGCLKLSTSYPLPSKTTYCYSLDRADKFIEENFKKKFIEDYHKKTKHRSWRRWRNPNFIGATHKEFKIFFEKCKEKEDKFTQFFLKHNTPIFVSMAGGNMTLNASLKQVEFYRVFDPYTAFQELQMYWGGLAVPQKPIPKISDADMLIAKGFDSRFSFRKDPGGKKRKKN